MFLYYANEESDDVIGGFIKTAVQHSIKNISLEVFKRYSLNLAPEM